jgi:hypothetical protein
MEAAKEVTVIEVPRGVAQSQLTVGARPRPIVPTDIDQIWRYATIVSKSGMAPKDMTEPATITVAIMHGLEVGLTPLMALQRIAVINGRPMIWGDGAIGLVRASGLCEFIDESIAGDGDNRVATCRVKRKGEIRPLERMFSVQDAKIAGLWNKKGPWQDYPSRMLQMRARAFALRDGFADVLGGLYIAEEFVGAEPMKDVTPPRTQDAPDPDAPVEPRPAPQPQPVEQPQQSSAPQGPDPDAPVEKPLFDTLVEEIKNVADDEFVTWGIKNSERLVTLTAQQRLAILDELNKRSKALNRA